MIQSSFYLDSSQPVISALQQRLPVFWKTTSLFNSCQTAHNLYQNRIREGRGTNYKLSKMSTRIKMWRENHVTITSFASRDLLFKQNVLPQTTMGNVELKRVSMWKVDSTRTFLNEPEVGPSMKSCEDSRRAILDVIIEGIHVFDFMSLKYLSSISRHLRWWERFPPNFPKQEMLFLSH